MAEQFLYTAIVAFFDATPAALNLLRHPPVSLRVLDWLCTNYAKSHDVHYLVDGNPFHLFNSYLDWLRVFGKRRMDPFARGRRIDFKGIESTIGQLNFFRWACTHSVLEFATKNQEKIETHMSLHAPRKLPGRPKRRQILTPQTSNRDIMVSGTTVRVKIPSVPVRKLWELQCSNKKPSDKEQVKQCAGPRYKGAGFTLDKFLTRVKMCEPERCVNVCK